MTVVINSAPGRVIVATQVKSSPAVTITRPSIEVDPGAAADLTVQREVTEVVVQQSPRTVDLRMGGFQGPAGQDGDKHYRHVQGTPAQVWVIDHNLDKHPAVSVVDSSGEEVEGNVVYTSQQQVVVTFAGAFSGEAFLN